MNHRVSSIIWIASLQICLMTHIEARRFPVRICFLAKSLESYINYNKILRKKIRRTKQPLYPEAWEQICSDFPTNGCIRNFAWCRPWSTNCVRHRWSVAVGYCRRLFLSVSTITMRFQNGFFKATHFQNIHLWSILFLRYGTFYPNFCTWILENNLIHAASRIRMLRSIFQIVLNSSGPT